nr:hypothetical protein [Olivibacter sp. SDN3]
MKPEVNVSKSTKAAIKLQETILTIETTQDLSLTVNLKMVFSITLV